MARKQSKPRRKAAPKSEGIVKDGAKFVTNCILQLNEWRANGVRHGDLSSRQMTVRDDVADLSQPPGSPPTGGDKPDAYYFWEMVHALVPDQRYVTRWQAVRKELGGDEDGAWDFLAGRQVTDLGCWDGDTLAMAVAEGAEGVGVDVRPDTLAVAVERWGRFGCRFVQVDSVMDDFGRYVNDDDALEAGLPEDIVFMFNAVWSWIVQRDEGLARAFLDRVIERSNVLFFETELFGDGPGASFLRVQDDVGELLAGKGRKVSRLATYAVGGRDAERCVWSVQ